MYLLSHQPRKWGIQAAQGWWEHVDTVVDIVFTARPSGLRHARRSTRADEVRCHDSIKPGITIFSFSDSSTPVIKWAASSGATSLLCCRSVCAFSRSCAAIQHVSCGCLPRRSPIHDATKASAPPWMRNQEAVIVPGFGFYAFTDRKWPPISPTKVDVRPKPLKPWSNQHRSWGNRISATTSWGADCCM